MKNSFLKLLGIIIVLIGVIALVVGFMFNATNANLFTVGSFLLIIIGLVVYIIINKHIY